MSAIKGRLAMVLLLAPAGLAAAPAAAQLGVTVENPIALERPSDTVTLPWAAIQGRIPGLRPDRVWAVNAATGAEVASQVPDARASRFAAKA